MVDGEDPKAAGEDTSLHSLLGRAIVDPLSVMVGPMRTTAQRPLEPPRRGYVIT